MRKLAVVFALYTATIVNLVAQTVGYKAVFTASLDHNAPNEFGAPIVSSYDIIIYAPGGTTPVATVNIGKPTPDATNTITADINSTVVALAASPNCNVTTPITATAPPWSSTCYVAQARTNGTGGAAVSVPSPPFTLVPRAPTAPGRPAVIRK